MNLSIIIPAHNEVENIEKTLDSILRRFKKETILFEIIVVDDHSTDNTYDLVNNYCLRNENVKLIKNKYPGGFGYAVRFGIDNSVGEAIALMMADLSDCPDDLYRFYQKLNSENLDCVFGSRFMVGAEIHNYPRFKFILNRVFNNFVKIIFGIKYNDITNAFKIYKKDTLDGLKPFLSPHFNLTLELPLKAIIRGFKYEVLPNKWVGREYGYSKLKIREMGSRYFFILLYCLVEKYFSMGDFKK